MSVITAGNASRKVLKEYEDAIAKNPESAELHSYYAMSLHSAGENDQAMEEYRRAIALKPDDDHAHCQLGFSLRDAGRWDESIAELKAALRLILSGNGPDPTQSEAITR